MTSQDRETAVHSSGPTHTATKALRSWKRAFLIAFSGGAGVVITLTGIAFGYNYYEEHARPARSWKEKDLKAIGVRVALKTEWRERQVLYRFQVRPESEDLAKAFAKAAESSPHTFTLLLYDSAGMRMCEQKLGELTRQVGQHGEVGGLESEGTFWCSLERYSDSRDWNVTFEFPSLFELRKQEAASLIPDRERAQNPTTSKAPASKVRNWRDKSQWRLLSIGMAKDDVRKLLGEPGKVSSYGLGGEVWYYPDALGGASPLITKGQWRDGPNHSSNLAHTWPEWSDTRGPSWCCPSRWRIGIRLNSFLSVWHYQYIPPPQLLPG